MKKQKRKKKDFSIFRAILKGVFIGVTASFIGIMFAHHGSFSHEATRLSMVLPFIVSLFFVPIIDHITGGRFLARRRFGWLRIILAAMVSLLGFIALRRGNRIVSLLCAAGVLGTFIAPSFDIASNTMGVAYFVLNLLYYTSDSLLRILFSSDYKIISTS